jgi:hypothetical protein
VQAGTTTVLAVRAPNGYLYDRECTASGWSAHWRQVSSQIRGNPALSGGPGAAIVYALGRDGRLRTNTRLSRPGAMWDTGGRRCPTAPAAGPPTPTRALARVRLT